MRDRRCRDFDAELRFEVAEIQVQEPAVCISGLVLQGMILFPMLAGSLFAEYRMRLIRPEQPGVPAEVQP